VGAIAALGCSNEALPGPGPRVPDFTVNVSTGSVTPDYSWDVGNAASLRVARTDAFSEVSWLITTENKAGDPVNNVASPVTHGVTPSGAVVNAANELTLEPGVTYQATVGRADKSAGFVEFICCN
jgi:hypothetical protein